MDTVTNTYSNYKKLFKCTTYYNKFSCVDSLVDPQSIYSFTVVDRSKGFLSRHSHVRSHFVWELPGDQHKARRYKQHKLWLNTSLEFYFSLLLPFSAPLIHTSHQTDESSEVTLPADWRRTTLLMEFDRARWMCNT